MQTGHSLPPSRPILSMLRIYIANKLTIQYKIDAFTRQAIDCMAIHIYQSLTTLMIKIKRVLSVQRRTIPNLLHLLFVIQSQNLYLDPFINYLVEKAERKAQRFQVVQYRNGIKNLFAKYTSYYEKKYEDIEHANILSVPENYIEKNKILAQPLCLKMPICLYVEKPEDYTYSKQSIQVKNFYKNNKQLIMKQVHAHNEIKKQLWKIKKFIKDNIDENDKKKICNQSRKRVKTDNKLSFDLAKYL